MKGERSIKEAKTILAVTLLGGILLLAAGFIFMEMNSILFSSHKALMALSLLPFSMAFVSFLKLSRLKNAPHKMKKTIIAENDERLVALKNEADAGTLKLLQGILFLAYFGYTFIFPEEVFASAGWWTLLVLLLVSLFAQSLLRHRLSKSQASAE